MCLGNYGAQMQGNLGKSVGMWLNPEDEKKQTTQPTVNIYNTLPNGDIRKKEGFDDGFNSGIKNNPSGGGWLGGPKTNRASLKSGKK